LAVWAWGRPQVQISRFRGLSLIDLWPFLA
jgi:hypothetical protein